MSVRDIAVILTCLLAFTTTVVWHQRYQYGYNAGRLEGARWCDKGAITKITEANGRVICVYSGVSPHGKEGLSRRFANR